MHKKICSMLMVIFLYFCLVPVGNAEATEIKLKVSDSFGVVGKEIIVSVGIENSARVSAGSFNIVYDPSYLKVKSCVKGSTFGNISPTINQGYAEGKIRTSWMAATAVDEGELFNITFETQKAGKTQVTLENVKLGSLYADALTYSTADGNITVSERAMTVLNESTVSSKDKAYIKKCGNEYEYGIENMDFQSKVLYAAEYNSDGGLKNVEIAEKKYKFSDVFSDGGIKLFVWDNKMVPLRKAVFMNKSGRICGHLSDEENVATISVTNPSSQTETVTLCAVQYDLSGKKIKSTEEKCMILSQKTEKSSIGFNLENACAYVEIFALNQGGELLGDILTFEV